MAAEDDAKITAAISRGVQEGLLAFKTAEDEKKAKTDAEKGGGSNDGKSDSEPQRSWIERIFLG